MIIFRAKDATRKRRKAEARTYIWLIELISISRNNSKDYKGTIIVILGIEVDTFNFLARLPKEKLDKAIKSTKKVLKEKSVSVK